MGLEVLHHIGAELSKKLGVRPAFRRKFLDSISEQTHEGLLAGQSEDLAPVDILRKILRWSIPKGAPDKFQKYVSRIGHYFASPISSHCPARVSASFVARDSSIP